MSSSHHHHHHPQQPQPHPDYAESHRDAASRGGGANSVISGHGSIHSSALPPQHHTSVTMTTDTNPHARVTEINLNVAYFKTIPGIVKLIQLVFGIICMACGSPAREFVGQYYGTGHNHWFLFVVVTAFIITLLWCFFYFLQIKDSIHITLPISWLKLEYFYTIITTLLYIIAFIVILSGFGYCAGSPRCDARIAAGVFGIFNTIMYAIGSYLLHQECVTTPPEMH